MIESRLDRQVDDVAEVNDPLVEPDVQTCRFQALAARRRGVCQRTCDSGTRRIDIGSQLHFNKSNDGRHRARRMTHPFCRRRIAAPVYALVRCPFSFRGKATDELVELPQVIVSQPVVVVRPDYCHECLRLVGSTKQLFARAERNRAICGPMTLKQRTMIADNLGHGVELHRWNQPRQLRVVDVGNILQGRERA